MIAGGGREGLDPGVYPFVNRVAVSTRLRAVGLGRYGRGDARPDRAQRPVAAGQVRCTYRWIVEGKRVLGGIALRHTGNDAVRWAGHIGYGIRPSARRRGLATWALGRILDEARVLGMDRLLIVCEAGRLPALSEQGTVRG